MSKGMTDIQVLDYYMRFREVALIVAKRGGVVVCNQKHQGFFVDLVDRLKEDPWWRLQTNTIDLTMMSHPDCPEDELLVWNGKGKLLRMNQFLGTDKGFGSFRKIAAPTADGIVDFGVAFDKLSKEEAKKLQPPERPASPRGS